MLGIGNWGGGLDWELELLGGGGGRGRRARIINDLKLLHELGWHEHMMAHDTEVILRSSDWLMHLELGYFSHTCSLILGLNDGTMSLIELIFMSSCSSHSPFKINYLKIQLIGPIIS